MPPNGRVESIRLRLRVVGRAVSHLQRFLRTERKAPPTLFAFALAFGLESFYTAIEDLFIEILRSKKSKVPSGSHWHRELLHAIGSVGVGLLTVEDVRALEPYLKFRHFARRQGLLVRPVRVRELAQGTAPVYTILQKAVKGMRRWQER